MKTEVRKYHGAWCVFYDGRRARMVRKCLSWEDAIRYAFGPAIRTNWGIGCD